MPRGKLTLLLLLLMCWTGHCRKRHWKKLEKRLENLENRLQALEKGTCHKRVECPLGFLPFKKSCFLFVMGKDKTRPWMDAKQYCQDLGANLITIKDAHQLRYVEKYMEGNFNRSKTELFTGLIATNYQAEKPFNPHMFRNGHSTSTKDSYRWTATKQAVLLPGRYEPPEPHARFHPDIQGPEVAGAFGYLSCVLLVWDPSAKHRLDRLIFMFGDCEKRLPFVCEVQPPRWKYCTSPVKQSKRYKRSAGYGPSQQLFDEEDDVREVESHTEELYEDNGDKGDTTELHEDNGDESDIEEFYEDNGVESDSEEVYEDKESESDSGEEKDIVMEILNKGNDGLGSEEDDDKGMDAFEQESDTERVIGVESLKDEPRKTETGKESDSENQMNNASEMGDNAIDSDTDTDTDVNNTNGTDIK